MKISLKAFFLASALGCTALLTSCGTPFPLGCLYTKVTLPLTAGSGEIKYNRIGKSECRNFLGWVAIGDASINKAAENGNITRISWASQRVENILGIYGTYTTIIYGFGENEDESTAPDKNLKD